MENKPCVRLKVEILGRSYYIIVGRDFTHVTTCTDDLRNRKREEQVSKEVEKIVAKIRERGWYESNRGN